MIEQWRGLLHFLAGVENNYEDGTDDMFNFLLCNGERSQQRDVGRTYYDHMMPERSHTKIRAVSIHYYNFIRGFSFFDNEGKLLLKIGYTEPWFCDVKTVLIAENEVIVGVVAKLYLGFQSVYRDFQFQIATGM